MKETIFLEKSKGSRFYYGWVVVIASFLMTFMFYSIQYNFGVFSRPLLDEFGWTRALTSGAFSLYMIVHGLSAILMGALSDRYEPRITFGVSGFLGGLGMVLCSQIVDLWQFYAFFGLLIGVGTGAAFSPPMSTTAKWFVKKRGLALGIVASGIGFGTLIMSPVANYLISAYGWQMAYIIVGFIAWIVLIPTALMIKAGPVENNALSYSKNREEGGNVSDEWDTSEAVKTRSFWLFFFSNLLWVLCLQMVMVHIYYYAIDIGAPSMIAAGVLALIGGFSVLGRLVIGGASDRVGTKRAWLLCLVCQMVIMFWLTMSGSVWTLYLFAPVFGFSYGGIVPLVPAITGEFFGTKNLGAIIGFMVFGPTIGGVLGPFIAGYIFDVTGSYYFAFLLGVAATIMATVLAIQTKKPERG
ncbi:MAG: MFS transporter [Candidatus Bathyarchaeota archaeon]|nr:MAG: MFS transporter [Candidatus Bathyarchaeota archaeon]